MTPLREAPGTRIADGFERQRLTFLPRLAVSRLLRDPLLADLLVTDAGWFPRAANHYRERRSGAPEVVIIMCSEGSGWCQIDDVLFDVGPGDVVVIPPSTPHRYGATTGRPWTIWWFHVTGARAEALSRAAAPDGGLVEQRLDVQRLLQLADETLRFMERGQSNGSLRAAAGCARHLLGLLGLSCTTPPPDPVQRAVAAMMDRVNGMVTVADLAALVNLSPSHFAAMFRRATGTSVLHHFIGLKMSAARDLLDAGHPVGAVAQRLGFRDASYFSRQFSRFHGMSPSDYRRERWLPSQVPAT